MPADAAEMKRLVACAMRGRRACGGMTEPSGVPLLTLVVLLLQRGRLARGQPRPAFRVPRGTALRGGAHPRRRLQRGAGRPHPPRVCHCEPGRDPDPERAELRQGRQRGARHAPAARGRYRVFTDADLAYPPSEVNKILRDLEAGADVAITACRVLPESRYLMSPTFFHYLYTRHVMSRVFNAMVRLVLLRDVLDTQAGLKGFTARAAQAVFSRLNDSLVRVRCGGALHRAEARLCGAADGRPLPLRRGAEHGALCAVSPYHGRRAAVGTDERPAWAIRLEPRRMRRLIVNADDFGFTPAVTAGILEAHAAGSVTSTSMLVRCAGWDDGRAPTRSRRPRSASACTSTFSWDVRFVAALSITDNAGRFLPLRTLAMRGAAPGDRRRRSGSPSARPSSPRSGQPGFALRTSTRTGTCTRCRPWRRAVASGAARHGLPLRRPLESAAWFPFDVTAQLHKAAIAAAWTVSAGGAAPRSTDHFVGISLQGGATLGQRLPAVLDPDRDGDNRVDGAPRRR